MAQRGVARASENALRALKSAVSKPGTEANKRAAEAVIALRQCFKHEGMTDWAGRSAGYRDVIERLYRQAKVPSDSESSMQANLRYHLGNALRKVAPSEDLAALGMAVDGPLSRVRRDRQSGPKRPADSTPIMDSYVLADVALSALRALSAAHPDRDIEPKLRAIIDEAVSVLAGLRAGDGNGN